VNGPRQKAWRASHPEWEAARRARVHPVRPKTLRRYALVAWLREHPRTEIPATRGECALVARPCPHIFCRWNLYLDVIHSREGAGLKINFPDIEPAEMHPRRSCVLDIADRGPASLELVGAAMNLVRERVRQIEEIVCRKVVHLPIFRELADG